MKVIQKLTRALGFKAELNLALQKRQMEQALRAEGLSRAKAIRAVAKAFDNGGKP